MRFIYLKNKVQTTKRLLEWNVFIPQSCTAYMGLKYLSEMKRKAQTVLKKCFTYYADDCS